ncbi:SKI/DACH domain-containing protein 1-like [Pantherophis guttatus]|uniref:SKI/DACH domain-containing protein 1-like n=1 Tax=Pantherophis guttatus TaxID=94885 RepID=A0ABM3YS48_PANGU|nr:SKI/DACH domain-containing protein 1-like [Pantherophis guttatus]XP_060538945.1 SKI/DACH domain-containing protein 1-like [Pantherophis guttatus]
MASTNFLQMYLKIWKIRADASLSCYVRNESVPSECCQICLSSTGFSKGMKYHHHHHHHHHHHQQQQHQHHLQLEPKSPYCPQQSGSSFYNLGRMKNRVTLELAMDDGTLFCSEKKINNKTPCIQT